MEDDILQHLEEFARSNYIPVMLDGGTEFLAKFVKEKQFQNILEVGTAIGYSGSIMLLSSKKAHLDTIEIDEKSFLMAKETFQKMHLTERVNQFLGDGFYVIQELKNQNKKYDLIFLDGPKGQYLRYYPILLQMLSPGGCLLVDNVLFHGLVRSTVDVGHKKRAMVNKLRQFVNEIETREDLITTIHEVGDGVAEIYVK